jgi:glycosyltransferase involved in cell wall biosynthesis
MLVSCVVPTWNRAKFIPGAIRSFLYQTFQDCELIIVDSGTDETPSLIPDHPRIKYFHVQEKLVCGAARNYGTERASGEIILNTDSDDWYSPNRVERQVAFHMKSGKAVTGYSYIVMHDLKTDAFNRYTMREPFLCGPTIIYSRAYWQNIDKIDPINEGEDWRFTQRASELNEVGRNHDDSVITCVARTHAANTVSREPLYLTPQWIPESKPPLYISL